MVINKNMWINICNFAEDMNKDEIKQKDMDNSPLNLLNSWIWEERISVEVNIRWWYTCWSYCRCWQLWHVSSIQHFHFGELTYLRFHTYQDYPYCHYSSFGSLHTCSGSVNIIDYLYITFSSTIRFAGLIIFTEFLSMISQCSLCICWSHWSAYWYFCF